MEIRLLYSLLIVLSFLISKFEFVIKLVTKVFNLNELRSLVKLWWAGKLKYMENNHRHRQCVCQIPRYLAYNVVKLQWKPIQPGRHTAQVKYPWFLTDENQTFTVYSACEESERYGFSGKSLQRKPRFSRKGASYSSQSARN
jgi:hypothetical protein